jgi:uncharacterized membrane protein
MKQFLRKNWNKILVGILYLVILIEVINWTYQHEGITPFSLVLTVLSAIFVWILSIPNDHD